MSGSRRSTPLPAGWDRIREGILRRDRHECQWPVPGAHRGICAARANQVDHVIPAYQGGSDDPGNLRSLCWPHHRDLSSQQAGQAWGAIRRRMKEQKFRKAEVHPGYLPGA